VNIQWQNAYDKLATYVADAERNSTLTYYFGVPVEFEGNHSATPHMLAFEVYNTREVIWHPMKPPLEPRK
jgi:hypothetical protein